MSHYADYVKERLGKLVFECEEGFAVYWYSVHPEFGECVYIEDIYVIPEKRRSKIGSWMSDMICEEASGKGVKTLLGSVNPQAKGSTASLKALLAYGMELDRISDNGLIYFSKDISDEGE